MSSCSVRKAVNGFIIECYGYDTETKYVVFNNEKDLFLHIGKMFAGEISNDDVLNISFYDDHTVYKKQEPQPAE